MTVTAAPLAVSENIQGTYRLDLRLGIPRARMKGALEWWLGDPGLCRGLEQHPYLILLEIDSTRANDADRIMHAVSRIIEGSGPIQVLVSLIEEIPREDGSLYRVEPSAGLDDFVLLFTRAFPVIVNQGTLAYSICEGTSGSFMAFHPVRLRDPARSGFGTPKKDKKEGPLQTKGAGGRQYFAPSSGNTVVPIDIFRIVLRKNDIPLAEYDLIHKRWLSPAESETGRVARSALRRFRIARGYQMCAPARRKEEGKYIISDLHLGHVNSIARYKRPFFPGDIREMDRVLIRNWNWTVNEADTVFYLGDLSYMSEREPEDYLRQLAGNIIYVEGNHDPCIPEMPHSILLKHRDVSYLLIHDPDELTRPFPGWVIHGHVHNKDLSKYPFFNPGKRTINVSAEMVGYRPISLDEIHDLVTGTSETLEFRELSQ